MKIILLLLIILSSCNTEIGSDDISESDGNGGTEVNIKDNETDKIESLTSPPFIETTSNLNNMHQQVTIRVEINSAYENLNLQSIKINRLVHDLSYSGRGTEHSFNLSFADMTVLSSVTLNFAGAVSLNLLKTFEISTMINGEQVIIYSAKNLDDSRSKVITANGNAAFNTKHKICSGAMRLNYQSNCVYYPVYCSDLKLETLSNKFCEIRDDINNKIYCYEVTSEQECSSKISNGCSSELYNYIEFRNQLLQAIYDGKMIATKQCSSL